MTAVGLGWLRGTIRTGTDEALAILAPFFGPSSPRSGGTRWYGSSATLADRRVLVAWDGIAQAAGTVMIDVTQTALDGLGWAGALDLAAALTGVGFRASRVDVFVDDRARRASARVTRAAIAEGHYVSHAQPGGYHEDDRTGAATAYLGARESERMLRVYDKDPNGEDPRTRFELELKGDAARDALARLVNQPDPDRTATGLLLGFVDFRERAEGERGDRAPRLAWWAALVLDVEKVRGVAAVVVDSLARRAGWVRRQVAPTLAALWARPEYGNRWLNEVLGDGLDRAGGMAWASS